MFQILRVEKKVKVWQKKKFQIMNRPNKFKETRLLEV